MSDTRDTIRERMLSNLPDTYNKLTGSWTWETYQATAIELENRYAELEDSVNQRFAGTADMENLKIIAFEKGVEWKDATKASGIVNVTGTAGATINIGDLFSNNINEYQAIETKILDSNGTATVKVECTVGGIIGNTPENTITEFPKTLAGINTVNNPQAFTNGYEAESREELLERYYEVIRRPATSGNVYHYEQWAKSVIGVGNAKVKPIWNGGGTVKVIIIDSNNNIPSQDLITETFNYIETVRPIGVNVTVAGPTEKTINISCKITLKQDYVLQSVKNTIQENLNKYFKDKTFADDNNIYYAEVGNIIFSSEGVSNMDYSLFTLNNAKDDIILIDNTTDVEIPKLGTLAVTN